MKSLRVLTRAAPAPPTLPSTRARRPMCGDPVLLLLLRMQDNNTHDPPKIPTKATRPLTLTRSISTQRQQP